jgi:hypothetical protein
MDIQDYRYMIFEREEEFRMLHKSVVTNYMPGVTPPPGALVEQP